MKTPTLFQKFASAIMLLAVITLNISPLMALDVQVLPENTAAKTGFTHVMNLKYTDVTNGVIYSQWRLYPRSGTFEANTVVDKVAVDLKAPFAVANANAGSNGVFMNIGITGATNAVLSQYLVGSNAIANVVSSNLVAPILISAATNQLLISLTYSNADMPALQAAGEANVYIRVIPFSRFRGF